MKKTMGAEHIRSVRKGKDMAEQYTKRDFPYVFFQTVRCYGSCAVKGRPLQSKERQYGDLVLPPSVEGEGKLVEIMADAFLNAKALTSVVIPEGVEVIGDRAFCGCTALRTVRLPSTLKHIGANAFFGCTGMTEPLWLPAGLESVGDGAFAGVPLPATDLNSEQYRFVGGCFVDLSAKRLLWGNTQSVIPADGTVETIAPYAFAYCEGLREIILPEGIRRIQDRAFFGCTAVERVDFPESLREIGREILSGAEQLSTLRIPAAVWRVTATALSGLPALKTLMVSVRLAPNVEKWGISRACNVIVAQEEESKTRARLSVCRAVRFGIDWMGGLQRITVARDGQTPEETYYEVYLPDDDGEGNTVNAIADSGFADCRNLTTVLMPMTIRRIGKAAFSRCHQLISVQLHEGLVEIGRDAFHGCENLEIELPASIKSIEAGAFCGVKGVRIAEGNPRYVSIGDCLIDREKQAVIFGGRDAEIPNDPMVQEIAYKAFYKQEQLKSIRIPPCIRRIGSDAFGKCSALSSVEIEEGLTEIASFAFRGCTSLRVITLPGSLETLGEHIFSRCTAIRSVTYPKKLSAYKNDWNCDIGAGKDCKYTISDSLFTKLFGRKK